MRKILLPVLLIAAFALQTFAQKASITVFSKEGEKFWVVINGIKQNANPQTNVKVTGLDAPNYKVKVIFEDEKIASVDKSIYTRDADGIYWDVTYVLQKNRKGVYVMNMSSTGEATVPEGQYSVPVTTTETQPQPTQTQTNQPTNNRETKEGTQTQTQTTTTTVDGTQNPGGNGGITINVVDPVTGTSVVVGADVNTSETKTTTTTTTVTTTTTGGGTQTQTQNQNQTQPRKEEPVKPDHYVMPGYNGPIGCAWPMAATDFDAAKKSISSKSFEDSKLTIAKQIIGANCLTASQVKEVMLLFSFEDTRFQFAKFAYPYTYDQGNYYKVNDAFSFESTIDDLNEFLSKQKR